MPKTAKSTKKSPGKKRAPKKKDCFICNEKRPTYGNLTARRMVVCATCAALLEGIDQNIQLDDINKNSCVTCGPGGARATFGPKDQDAAIRCLKHKIPGDEAKSGPFCGTCTAAGKKKRALFAPFGEDKPTFCFTHKPDVFWRPGSDSCQTCKRVAADFGPSSGGQAVHCYACKMPDEINVAARHCESCDVGGPLIFGPVDSTPVRCAGCRLNDDLNHSMRKCYDCHKKQRIYGPSDGSSNGEALYCNECAERNIGAGKYENLVSARCSTGCGKLVVNDGFCLTCHPEHVAKHTGYSKAACRFFDALQEELRVLNPSFVISHKHFDASLPNGVTSEQEYRDSAIGKPVDGYCAATRTVYEYHGDVFHGHPRLWEKDPRARNYLSGKLLSELYSNTELKMKQYKAAGYRVLYVWESDALKQASCAKKAAKSAKKSSTNSALPSRVLHEFIDCLEPRPRVMSENESDVSNKRARLE